MGDYLNGGSLLSYLINFLINSFKDNYGVPIDEISNQINIVTKGINMGVAAFQLILFLLICFFGYRLLKIIITIDGALTGLLVGIVVGVIYVIGSGEKGLAWITLVTAFGFMLLFGFLAFKLYRFGIFLHYFLLGTLFFAVLLVVFGVRNPWIILAISAVVGLIIGFFALVFNKFYIIISSALIGGLCAGDAVGTLIETNKEGVKILIGIIIAILGAVFQFWLENKKYGSINGNESIKEDNEKFIIATKGNNKTKVYCTKCGAQSPIGCKFCSSCGAGLYSSPQHSFSKEEIVVPTNIIFTGNEDKKTLKTRMNDALEDGRWGEALLFADRVINTDAEDGEGYLGALMAENKISNIELIEQLGDSLSESKYYKGFFKYADNTLTQKVKYYEKKAKVLQWEKTAEILDSLAKGIRVLKSKQNEEKLIEDSLKKCKKNKSFIRDIIGIIISLIFVEMFVFFILGIFGDYYDNVHCFNPIVVVNHQDFNSVRQFFDPSMWVAILCEKFKIHHMVYHVLHIIVLLIFYGLFLKTINRKRKQKESVKNVRLNFKNIIEEEQNIISGMAPFLSCTPVVLRSEDAIIGVLKEYENNMSNTVNEENSDIFSIIENYNGDISKVDKHLMEIPYEGINGLSSKYERLAEFRKIIDVLSDSHAISLSDNNKIDVSQGFNKFTTYKCNHCGALLENGASYCIKCGMKVESQSKKEIETNDDSILFCTSCGTKIKAESKFCTRCGVKVEK